MPSACQEPVIPGVISNEPRSSCFPRLIGSADLTFPGYAFINFRTPAVAGMFVQETAAEKDTTDTPFTISYSF